MFPQWHIWCRDFHILTVPKKSKKYTKRDYFPPTSQQKQPHILTHPRPKKVLKYLLIPSYLTIHLSNLLNPPINPLPNHRSPAAGGAQGDPPLGLGRRFHQRLDGFGLSSIAIGGLARGEGLLVSWWVVGWFFGGSMVNNKGQQTKEGPKEKSNYSRYVDILFWFSLFCPQFCSSKQGKKERCCVFWVCFVACVHLLEWGAVATPTDRTMFYNILVSLGLDGFLLTSSAT